MFKIKYSILTQKVSNFIGFHTNEAVKTNHNPELTVTLRIYDSAAFAS